MGPGDTGARSLQMTNNDPGIAAPYQQYGMKEGMNDQIKSQKLNAD